MSKNPLQVNRDDALSSSEGAITSGRIPEQDAPASAPAIEISELTKHFKHFCAVDHLSLTVQRGEIFGLLGPNGSGKTTTVNMLCGLSAPDSGRIEVMGLAMPREARRVRKILGAVPQETALYEELTAWHNMDFHARLFGVARKERRERITRMLKLVQLLESKDSRVHTFSGGMKRRLALARALLHEPQLIYLDEPTLGVDVQSRRAIWDYILSQRDQGRTVLLTTNYLEEAQALCDRLAIIDHGKLLVIATPDHLKRMYGRSVIEVETTMPIQALNALRAVPSVIEVRQNKGVVQITIQGASNPLAPIVNIISQECEINGIAIRESSLDEVFLQLTGTVLRD